MEIFNLRIISKQNEHSKVIARSIKQTYLIYHNPVSVIERTDNIYELHVVIKA